MWHIDYYSDKAKPNSRPTSMLDFIALDLSYSFPVIVELAQENLVVILFIEDLFSIIV